MLSTFKIPKERRRRTLQQCWALWLTPVIPALRTLRPKDCDGLWVRQDYSEPLLPSEQRNKKNSTNVCPFHHSPLIRIHPLPGGQGLYILNSCLFSILCRLVLCLPVSVCIACRPGAPGQKRAEGPELESQTVVNHHVGSANHT